MAADFPESLPLNLNAHASHVVRLTHSVFIDAFSVLWRHKEWDTQDVQKVLDTHYKGKKKDSKKTFTAPERKLLRAFEPMKATIELLQKLLFFAFTSGQSYYLKKTEENTLEHYLVKSCKHRCSLKHAKSADDVSQCCRELRQSLTKLLTKIEEKTGENLSETMKKVSEDPPPSCMLSNHDMFSDVFKFLMPGLQAVVLDKICDSSLSIRDHLVNEIGTTQYMKCLTESQRNDLETSTSSTGLRWKTSWKVIKILLGEGTQNLLVTQLEKLIDIRNNIVRSPPESLTDKDCENSAFQCHQIVCKILLYVENTYGQSFKSSLAKMAKIMHDLSLSAVVETTDEVPPLPITAPSKTTTAVTSNGCQTSAEEATVNLRAKPPSSQDRSFRISYCEESLCQYSLDDMNVIRVFKALQKGGPATRVFIEVLRLLPDQPVTQLKYQGKTLKPFTRDEKKHIENNTPLVKLDLSFLYKVIGIECEHKLGNQEFWNKPSNLEGHYLYCVKNSRNFLVHEAIVYTKNDLDQIHCNLQNWLQGIIKYLSHETGTTLSDFKAEISNELHEIFTKPLPTDMEDVNCYARRMCAMRKQLPVETMSKARKELKKYYDRESIKILNPISWYHNPDEPDDTKWLIGDLYTDLEIKDSGGTCKCGTLLTKDILKLYTSQVRVVVIQGAAGSGKTSICKFFLQCWSSGKNSEVEGLAEVDLMIFIQCRHVHSDSLTGFFADSLLKETLHSVESSEVISSLNDARILFIIDGYDEANSKARNVVEEALDKFPSSSAIITTRPEYRPEVDTMIFHCRDSGKRILLSAIGFGDKGRSEYVEKVFRTFSTDPQPFLIFLHSIDEYVSSFTHLPLTLAFLCLVWINSSEKPTKDMTVTQLYQRIISFFLKRFSNRQRRKQGERRSSEDIENSIEKWLQTLGEVAWSRLKKKEMCLGENGEKKLRNKSEELHIDPTDALSSVLQCQVMTCFGCEHKKVWEFVQKTVQEYLAGLNLVSEMKDKGKSLLDVLHIKDANNHEKTKDYSRLIEFIAGIFVNKECMTEEIANQILQIYKVQTPWAFDAIASISRECAASEDFKKCLAKMFDGDELPDTLENYDLQSVHSVLLQTSLKLPATINVIPGLGDLGKMKPLTDFLVRQGCYLQLHMKITGLECIHSTVDSLSTFSQLSQVKFILHVFCGSIFPTVLKVWPWEKLPLILQFPKQLFPLLWLQLCSHMEANGVRPSEIVYNGDPRGEKPVEKLCEKLGMRNKYHQVSNYAQIAIHV